MPHTIEVHWRCDFHSGWGCSAEKVIYFPTEAEQWNPPAGWGMDKECPDRVLCPAHNPENVNLTYPERLQLMDDGEAKKDIEQGYLNVLSEVAPGTPHRHLHTAVRYARILAEEIRHTKDIYHAWSVVQDHLEEMYQEKDYGFLAIQARVIQENVDSFVGKEAIAAKPEVRV
jgi:hypothetical protein